MGIEDILRIDRIQGQGPQNAGEAAQPKEDFRRLLEQIQELAKKNQAAPENADELARALQEAKKDFGLAMDLRAQLEDAFRKKMS